MKLFKLNSYYDSLEVITVVIFFKIMETKNYSFLYKSKSNIKRPATEKMIEAWADMYDSYSDALGDNKSRNYYHLIDTLGRLRERYKILQALIFSLNDSNRDILGPEISAWGFQFNTKALVGPQMPLLKRQLKAATNAIKLKVSELETIESSQKKKATNVLRDKVNLEYATGLKIDIHTCVMSEWIEIIKLAEELKAASRKKRANNE